MTQAKHTSKKTKMVNVTFQESICTGGECVGTVPQVVAIERKLDTK